MMNQNLTAEISFKTENMIPFSVVYMRRTGCYGSENQKLMEQFKTWVKNEGLFFDDAVILGIALDDVQRVLPQNCRYDVCLIVPDDYAPEDRQVSKRMITGGRYAVLQFPHTAEAVQKAWSEGMVLLISKGYILDYSRPIMERYDKGMVDKHQCELCIPIQ